MKAKQRPADEPRPTNGRKMAEQPRGGNGIRAGSGFFLYAFVLVPQGVIGLARARCCHASLSACSR